MQSFALAFGKPGQTYKVDRVLGGESSKHLKEIGFINGAKLEILSNQKNGLIVKVLNAKIALDFSRASRIYVHEMVCEEIQEM